MNRLAGVDRIETAVAISRDSVPGAGSADAVVLARGDDPSGFADALAGTPLAFRLNAPILITFPGGLHEATENELRRVLGAGGTVYILGGEQALHPAVADRISELGYRVERVYGATRIETAIEIANELGNPSTIMLATGFNFPDALAAGAAEAHVDGAVLLTAGEGTHPAVDAYLADHQVEDLVAIGGPAARAYPAAAPLVGGGREETAALVAARFFADPTAAGVAYGYKFPDRSPAGSTSPGEAARCCCRTPRSSTARPPTTCAATPRRSGTCTSTAERSSSARPSSRSPSTGAAPSDAPDPGGAAQWDVRRSVPRNR